MSRRAAPGAGPHQGQPVITTGEPLSKARAAMVLVHGRGATAASILTLAAELPVPGFAFLAPQAAGNSWYPQSFMAPLEENEPYLSSALLAIYDVLTGIVDAGISVDRTILLGFSQGACLVLEFSARNATRYSGVVGLSGALIGPDDTPRDYSGSLEGTPVFLGCSDRDPHVPKERVDETAEILRALGGEVEERIYPGLGHTVNRDELDYVERLMRSVAAVE